MSILDKALNEEYNEQEISMNSGQLYAKHVPVGVASHCALKIYLA